MIENCLQEEIENRQLKLLKCPSPNKVVPDEMLSVISPNGYNFSKNLIYRQIYKNQLVSPSTSGRTYIFSKVSSIPHHIKIKMKRVGVIPVCKTRSTKYNKEESGGEDYQETTNFGSLTKWWFALSIDMNYGELTDFGGSMSLKIDNGDILKTAKREIGRAHV